MNPSYTTNNRERHSSTPPVHLSSDSIRRRSLLLVKTTHPHLSGTVMTKIALWIETLWTHDTDKNETPTVSIQGKGIGSSFGGRPVKGINSDFGCNWNNVLFSLFQQTLEN